MRDFRGIPPRVAVLALVSSLVVVFLVGLFLWLGGLKPIGTVLMLLALYALVFALVGFGCVVLAGLPKPVPFAERNLLTARLAWAGRSLWAAMVLAAGGYFGAIIATDLNFEASGDSPSRVSYLVSIAVLLAGFAAVFVLVPIAVVSGVGLLRAGREGRSRALRKSMSRHGRSDRWVQHLASPVYAWATLIGLIAAVPLAYALLFWITFSLGVTY
ncbi:hypothetical protein ACFC1W_11050 [Microbacterium sp. NPDC056003]|uniref:hypothetical protein n=1 Tax=Microbacterium sp. NPDC056003 TaxID=3345676 RepID=UPI0035DDB460